MFEKTNPTRATMTIQLAWNNGPFDDAIMRIVCCVGDRIVFECSQKTSHQEMDFAEVLHVACREASRLVMGHRVTNSHIKKGRVVYSALNVRSWDLHDECDADEYAGP